MTARSKYIEAQPFTATNAGKVTAARAVQIHVPTIVASTYDRKGKLQGNQMDEDQSLSTFEGSDIQEQLGAGIVHYD